MLRAALASMLARTRPVRQSPRTEPDVAVLLDVDCEYCDRAERGSLPLVAARRVNPRGEAWLPVLHTERGPWQVTALFSNMARAHEFGHTRDWVVMYFHTDSEVEGHPPARGPAAPAVSIRPSAPSAS
jgi:hypothetical protein